MTAALLPSAIADIGGEPYFAWVTTSFMVASVLTSMLVARVLATRGAARSYLVAFALFALGSVGAALAPTMEVLIGARLVQGLGGGLLAGLGYAVIREALPPHLWTRATGFVSAMWAVGTLLGPTIGGLFAQIGFWRGAFWLLAALAVVLAVVSVRRLPHHTDGGDLGGRLPVLSLAALVLSALAFSLAAVVPVGAPTALAIGAGVVLGVGFVLLDRREASPVLPLITYRRGNPLKWLYVAVGVLCAAGMVEMFLPKFGQELIGMSPFVAGLFGATVSIGWSVVQMFSASVDDARRSRRLMITALSSYAAWVALNAVAALPVEPSAPARGAAESAVAAALRTGEPEAAAVIGLLRDKGLVDAVALTSAGRAELGAERTVVADVTATLVEGLDASDEAATRRVLAQLRSRADERLDG